MTKITEYYINLKQRIINFFSKKGNSIKDNEIIEEDIQVIDVNEIKDSALASKLGAESHRKRFGLKPGPHKIRVKSSKSNIDDFF